MHTLRIVSVMLLLSGVAAAAHAQYSYFPLTPCRVVDTRNPASVNGGPSLAPGTRSFQVRGNCGVPTTAKAVSLNVTVTNATEGSFLSIWPSGLARPLVSTINFDPTEPALANGAIVGVSTNAQDLSVFNASGNVNLILDVTGYFQ